MKLAGSLFEGLFANLAGLRMIDVELSPEREDSGHECFVQQVKELQRQSENARQAWKTHCDSHGEGIRDPRKHSIQYLQDFLSAHSAGLLETECVKQDTELAQVSSSEPALGTKQLVLHMPSSERGIMKEVVSTNVYGFLPGRACVLRGGDTVLDIGAHVGIAATLACRTEDVRVICVEPHPFTFKILGQNMTEHSDRVVLINKAVAETADARPLYVHCGTNAPSRLYFSSLFDTRRHDEQTIAIECVALQELLDSHSPTVIKIDAEGAERFLVSVTNFRSVRLLAAEWDWTHNRNHEAWQSLETHLHAHGFTIEVKGRMPTFDADGNADLYTANGKKRGNTGMIFSARRVIAFEEI